jgi:hypothetical protein
MAGQSNMQGQAQVRTIERLSLTEDSKPMYQDMKVKVLGPNEVAAEAGINGILLGKTDKTAVNVEVSASGLKPDALSLEVQK